MAGRASSVASLPRPSGRRKPSDHLVGEDHLHGPGDPNPLISSCRGEAQSPRRVMLLRALPSGSSR